MSRKDFGSTASSPTRYGSLASFYTADPRRIESRELDVGLWWREGVEGPLHRAAWVSETGELYLVRLGPDTVGGGRVEVLGTVEDRDRLESELDGWREHCGEPRSLAWLRGRAARLRTSATRDSEAVHRRAAAPTARHSRRTAAAQDGSPGRDQVRPAAPRPLDLRAALR